jgi:hypothetical protein
MRRGNLGLLAAARELGNDDRGEHGKDDEDKEHLDEREALLAAMDEFPKMGVRFHMEII